MIQTFQRRTFFHIHQSYRSLSSSMSAAVQAIAASNTRILSSLRPAPHVVVVGGTSGIGRSIALCIARHCADAQITIIGRNEAAAASILSQLGANPKFLRADVSLMSEIRSVTRKINAVDMLILTQGILTMDGRTPTSENIDNKLALHYYGRVLFVQELLPLLRSSPTGGKVLFVLDGVNGNPSKVNWNDMALEQSYSLAAAANHAMSFTDFIIQHLATQAENANVTFTHAFPGVVRTPLANSLPFWARFPMKCAMAVGVGVDPDQCAELMIHGMLGTERGSWRCVNDKGETVKKKTAAEEEMVKKAWDHTLTIIAR